MPTATTSPSCGFSLARVGDDDPAGRLLLGLDAADEHAIVQRTKFHAFTFLDQQRPLSGMPTLLSTC